MELKHCKKLKKDIKHFLHRYFYVQIMQSLMRVVYNDIDCPQIRYDYLLQSANFETDWKLMSINI